MKYLLTLIAIITTLHSFHYKGFTIEGDRFKIEFTDGVIFDACKCGCEKDASEALSHWQKGDEVEITPFVKDAKGLIYILTNLSNDVCVYSWLKTSPPKTTNLPIIHSPGSLPNTLTLSDNSTWFIPKLSTSSWKPGQRILVHQPSELEENTYLLINLDYKTHLKAYPWQM